MTGSNHITWWRIQILQTFGELHWELIHELSMKIKLDGWCWHTYTFPPYWKGDSFKMDFSTFQDNVNPPEVTRVLPSMEELCTSPVPKNLPTQIPHSNNFTYDCPSPNDIFVHQSTPYVPPARPMPPIIHTPMIPITLSKFSGYANEDGEKFISDFTAAMTLQGILADVSRVSAFSLYLSGPAFLWFETLPPSHKSS